MADNREEEYKALSFYKKHSKTKQSGFSKFTVDQEHFFCRHVDGEICLLSQAYVSEAGRDNGIESVIKNSKLSKRFKIEERAAGKYGLSLKAGNHQEIAISPDFASRKKAEFLAGRMSGTVKAAAKASTVSKPKKKAAPKKAAVATAAAATAVAAKRASNDEQNYKPLAFYKKHTKGKTKGFESFNVDGQHYFAYFENNEVALMSEGYPTTAAHDVGLESVKKNMTNPDRYKYRGPLKKSGKYDFSLRAGNHKEIARSVWYGSAAAAATGAAYIMGKRRRTAPKAIPAAPIVAAAAATAAAAPAMAKPAAPIVAAKPAPVATAAPIASTPQPDVEVVERSGLPGWLKWLLLALLALLALFFLLKMCKPKAVAPVPPAVIACWDGSEAETEAACPTKVTCWDDSFATSNAACPAEPPKVEAAPDPVTYTCWDGSSVANLASCPTEPTFTCWDGSTVMNESNCAVRPVRSSAAATSLFIPPAVSPVNVTRLGTNPEFGDSHSLTPSGFCDKLAAQYATNDYDRKYLNYLAKELGYASFNDMPNSACSNATLNYGTTGILGYGSQHGLQYSTLNVTDARDLEAFQITGVNGRTVYFMKTCGNYFFPTN